MSKSLEELANNYGELINDYNVREKDAAILVLADVILSLADSRFQPAMQEFGHELALCIKHIAKESVFQTETDLSGSINVVNIL